MDRGKEAAMNQDRDGVLLRLRTVAGHVKAVERMVEEDKYCIDIIHQTQAIKRALDKVEEELLSQHLETCVATALVSEEPGERKRVINEVMDVFKAKNKL
jgi:CsoR family transcriptional regulator, copper-sensing transcriptional repressor